MAIIAKKVLEWFESNGRELTWRESRDPYQIWVSEIIFQQTRIQQGVAYFYRFLERFPDVHTLAKADLDEVLKSWEGLGYYSRARNLHKTAQFVASELGGKFPDSHTELVKLKGIGPYTSRAIGSFAFDNPVGVLDGNVLRVLSRVTGDFAPINQGKARKAYQEVIDSWARTVDSRTFNFAMMDIGATICSPTKPGCLICPLQADCVANQEGLTHLLPQKVKTLIRKVRYFHFFLVCDDQGNFAIQKRAENVFWGGLWEIPNEEVNADTWDKSTCPNTGKNLGRMKHVFTHFDMMIKVCRLNVSDFADVEEYMFISSDKIRNFAFSRAVTKIFEKFTSLGVANEN